MDSNNPLLTQDRLVAMSMGAPTEEEREAARRLLEAGLFRQPTREEATWAEHPFHLMDLYAHEIDSPAGKWIADLIARAPDEGPRPEDVIVIPTAPDPPVAPQAEVVEPATPEAG